AVLINLNPPESILTAHSRTGARQGPGPPLGYARAAMEDLLQEFLTETNESLDVVDNELVRFEQEPNNAEILGRIFRLVHTIKGTCGFIGLPRLEALAHAAETVMGKFRDGAPVTADAVSLVLVTI